MPENDLKNFDHEAEVIGNGRRWRFDVGDLSMGRGMCARLDGDYWLDWHDVLDHPDIARPHFCPSADGKVSDEVKIRRMTMWQLSIVQMDDMMIDVEAPLTPDFVKETVLSNRLPKPTILQHSTTHPSLLRLFDHFGFLRGASSCIESPWTDFAEIARRGDLLREWLRIRKK